MQLSIPVMVSLILNMLLFLLISTWMLPVTSIWLPCLLSTPLHYTVYSLGKIKRQKRSGRQGVQYSLVLLRPRLFDSFSFSHVLFACSYFLVHSPAHQKNVIHGLSISLYPVGGEALGSSVSLTIGEIKVGQFVHGPHTTLTQLSATDYEPQLYLSNLPSLNYW